MSSHGLIRNTQGQSVHAEMEYWLPRVPSLGNAMKEATSDPMSQDSIHTRCPERCHPQRAMS
jgi:hypothetical protein